MGFLFFFLFFFFFFFFFFFLDPKLRSNVEKGFEIQVNGQKDISKGFVLTGTMDSPAKADVQHHTHHNGHCGCPFCLNPGESARTGKGSTHVYRCEPHADRTHGRRVKDAEQALQTGKPVMFTLLVSPFWPSLSIDWIF